MRKSLTIVSAFAKHTCTESNFKVNAALIVRTIHQFKVFSILLLHFKLKNFLLVILRNTEDSVRILTKTPKTVVRRIQEKKGPERYHENNKILQPDTFNSCVILNEYTTIMTVRFFVHPNYLKVGVKMFTIELLSEY